MSEPKLDSLESKLAVAEFDVGNLRIELNLALKRELKAIHERDELRAEVERLSKLENSLPASLRDAHVVVEKLRARLRTVAERQREACAYHMIQEQDYSAQACRRAPLVTEGDE